MSALDAFLNSKLAMLAAGALLGSLVTFALNSARAPADASMYARRGPAPSDPFNLPATGRAVIVNSKTEVALDELEAVFTLTRDKLSNIVKNFVHELKKGLDKEGGSSMKMIPSYVIRRPTGKETGTYLALDLGGTNFRVCEVVLEGHSSFRVRQQKFSVSEDLKVGHVDKLFDFLATCVESFLIANEINAEGLTLGFTFSFPVHQTGIASGTLLHWNKGFTCEGAIGRDPVQLLQEAFGRKNLKIKVAALVNDTVGTLVAHAYEDPQTRIGVILGTGTNAAYTEKLEVIGKWTGGPVVTGEMIINTEWGGYDQNMSALPLTMYDRRLDEESSNPGSQLYEKMISGLYLGNIVRHIILDFVKQSLLFGGQSSEKLRKNGSFETAMMSRIERDYSVQLSDTRVVLEDLLGIRQTTLEDRYLVKRIVELVAIRAARLAAVGVAALLIKINSLSGCTVAIDGSVFEAYPHFGNRMKDALREIFGLNADNVTLSLASSGSSVGAALIAALA